MGRVKDYILASPADRNGAYRFEALILRDHRGQRFSAVLLLFAMLRLTGAALRGKAALLHVHMGDRGSILRKGALVCLARVLGVPSLLHLHAVEIEDLYRHASGPKRWFVRLPFRAAGSIVALGERPRRWMVDAMGIAPEKIDIIINGVPSRDVAPANDEWPAGPCRIVFLGNLIARKGVAELLAALDALPADIGAWECHLAGGGSDEAFYKGEATKLDVADKLYFRGWLDTAQTGDLLASADMLVLPSYEEGLPLVILEALGQALPVVCTPVGTIPEVLHDGETVLLVPPRDSDALCNAIGRLIADPGLRRRIGANGRALYERRFSLAAFQGSLFALYKTRFGIDYRADGR